MKILLLVALCVCTFALTGCAAIERAQQIYETRAGQADEAYKAWSNAIDKLEEAEGDVRDFQRQWDKLNDRVKDAEADLAAAVASGDLDAIKAAGDKIDDSKNELKLLKDKGDLVLGAIKTAKGHADEAKKAYDASEDLVKTAAQDLEAAKSSSDYIGTILGWLGLGITTVLTGGKALSLGSKLNARTRENDDAESAIRRIYKTNEAKLEEDDLKKVKMANAQYMTLAEREAARRALR